MPLQLTTIAEASPEPPAKRVCTPAAAALAAAPAAAPLQYVYCFETLGDKKVVVIGQTNNIEATLNRVNSSHAACGMQFRFRCAALTLDYERDAWLTRNYFASKLTNPMRGYFDVPYEAVWRFFEKVIKPMHKYESEYAHEASSTSSEDPDDDSEESEESEDEAAVTS